MNEEIYRLAKPKKKGLAGLIFSRFLIIAVLLALQIAFYVGLFFKFKQYSTHLTTIVFLLTLAMVIYLFLCPIDASGKLTWLLVIFAVPVIGVLLFLFTETNIGHRTLKKRAQATIDQTRDAIRQPEGVLEELREEGGNVDDLVYYLNRTGCFPAFKNTEVTYFPLGENKFEAMLEELKKAEHFIFMEYFIIEEGYMWGKILEILVEKASQGVEVRVMYDGMCEMSTLPADYWRLLEKKGIKAKAFAPIIPVLSSHYNYRDHRKILVIDGKVAFNGGVNLADEYINRIERFGHWKDTAVMLKGDAARSFALLFLQMWNINEKEPVYDPYLTETGYTPEHSSGYVIPYGDCPLDNDKVGETVYMDILNRAGEYVHVMTPYLILDGELEAALKYAAERGIDVKLILPGIPDKVAAYSLAKSHFHSLTRAGVKIYTYDPGFVHAKVVTCDDIKAVVGTINMDYRSLYHHFECATFMYKTDCIAEIEKDFQETLAKCSPVTEETIRKEKFGYKALGAVMKFIAPLM
ncbi:MAG: cardiolipin synthase [Lachnospiraceae bacterium]|nr:cardiolipin synthase [Lachnospiraceae bacterium]